MKSAKVGQTVLILGFLVTTVFSIKCFQCNSAEDPECSDLTLNDTNSSLYHECPTQNGTAYFCRKYTQLLKGSEDPIRVIRACGWILKENETRVEKCKKSDSDFIARTSCRCFTDACNSAFKFNPSSILIPSLLLGLLTFIIV